MFQNFMKAVAVMAMFVGGAAHAANTGDVMTYYYRSPDPSKIASFLVELDQSGLLERKASTVPPTLGFFGALFMRHPEYIDTWTSGSYSPVIQRMIAAALHVSGRGVMAADYARKNGIYDEVAVFLQNAPPLKVMQIRSTGDLDVMWGATFAAGNSIYVDRIIDMVAKNITFGAYGDDVLLMYDVMQGRADKSKLKSIVLQYGEERFVEMASVASAVWSIVSNSKQHPFVAKAVQDRISKAPKSMIGDFFTRAMARDK